MCYTRPFGYRCCSAESIKVINTSTITKSRWFRYASENIDHGQLSFFSKLFTIDIYSKIYTKRTNLMQSLFSTLYQL